MGKDLLRQAVRLQPGDLVIDKTSSEVGILMQKHKVLRSYQRVEGHSDSRWYYAWRIKWNKESAAKQKVKWVDLLENSLDEKKLLRDIEEGKYEHYSNKTS